VPSNTFIEDPTDKTASPRGWHDDGRTVSRDSSCVPLFVLLSNILTLTVNSSGNNVITFIGRRDQTTKESVAGTHQFKYFYDIHRDPKQGQNPDAARTSAFYTSNVVHDIAYRYGFTEKAFNFQSNNFGKGGEGGDPVLVSVHNDKDMNDARFYTPPECVKFL